MVKLVGQADMDFLHGIVNDYRTGFNIQHAIIVHNLERLLEEVSGHLGDARNRSIFSSQTLYSDGFTTLLNTSLNAFLSMNFDTERRIKDTPSSLVPFTSNECQHELTTIETFFSNPSQIPGNQNTATNRYPDFYAIKNVRDCVNGLEIKLHNLFSSTGDLVHVMNNSVGRGSDFEYGEHLSEITIDLDILQNDTIWLSKQLSSYSENRTTKIELANRISQTMLSKIKHSMNHIIAFIDVNVTEHLLYRTKELDIDMPMVYARALNAMRTLAPYYESADVGNKLRVLQIWRHPMAKLGSGDVLQFMHPASEAWRTWPLSVPMDEFILNGNAAKLISSMVKEYNTVLRDELLRMRSQFNKARNDVISAFEKVLGDLKDVRIESVMADDFILWVYDDQL